MLKKIYNESTKTWCRYDEKPLLKGVVYWDNNYIEIGFFDASDKHLNVFFPSLGVIAVRLYEGHPPLYFNRAKGVYSIEKPSYNFVYGYGDFPYSITRYYSTRYLEECFHSEHIEDNNIIFNYIEELPYTYGLEFETCAGYIPENDLYKVGLIPLRDGSISGLEYSTIVLKGNDGLNTLKKEIDILKEYTIFDKDCSLHIHFGGFKLSPKVLLRLNNLFAMSDINNYLVKLAFNTEEYKSNGKSYCSKNSTYKTFDAMYSSLVGRPFFGDLYQAHPCDLSGDRKWNIVTRYKALNLINTLCYNNAKTAEFRFLRPTYNFNKILIWLFILGAFIKYAENTKLKLSNNISIFTIIDSVYSIHLAKVLKRALDIQYYVVLTQKNAKDYYGMRVDIEDNIMTYKNLSDSVKFFY